MKDILKQELWKKIYRIVFNKDKSINESGKELYKYLKEYNWYELHDGSFPIEIPNEQTLQNMIIDSYKTPNWEETMIFEIIIDDVSKAIIHKTAINLIDKK